MKASFVIVNYNRKDELLTTISKSKALISDHQIDYEFVIVDNGSADGSADAVKSAYPDVVLIDKKENIGAPAWNEGFEAATGDFFIILDDDSHVESGLEEALHYINDHQEIGVLALNIVSGPYTSADWNMQENKNIFGFIGCGAIFRKSTYKKIGGYADWIFLYANEWDLGLRTVKAGYEVRFFENCKVVHRTNAMHRTTKRLSVLSTKHELAIIYKYFPKNRWKYIWRAALNKLKVIKELDPQKAWYVLLGVNEFLKIRSVLPYTPVSYEVQKEFIDIFPSTQKSVLGFTKRIIKGNT